MTVRTPTFLLNAAGAQRPGGDVMRLLVKELEVQRGVSVTASPLLVVQNGSPNMSVNVGAGGDFIPATEGAAEGFYFFYNDATVNLAIAAADPTNPRRDLVIADVRDAQYSGANNDARLTVLQGTPAASPADPDPVAAGYKNYDVVARVAVAALATSIVNANITDLRTLRPFSGVRLQQAVLSGGPTSGTTELTIGTLTLAAQPTAYTLVCDCCTTWTAPTTDDAYRVTIKVDGTAKGQQATRSYGSSARLGYAIPSTTSVVIAANTSSTVTVTITRFLGTGTASIESGNAQHIVTAHQYFG